jgi:transcriptional regulator with XRE-family HTH domain
MNEQTARRLLAENLRVLRLLRGWSQEELAERAHLHRTYISGLERAQRNVGLDNLAKLAAAFGVGIPELFVAPDAKTVGERLLASIRETIDSKGNGHG